MKRKRGNKKGKPKRPSVVGAKEAVPNVVSLNTEDNSGVDDFDNDEFNSGMEVETPSSTGTDQPEKLANINSDGLPEKAAVKSVYGRVKVKIKTSKVLDSQLTSSDAPTRSDTDKSTQQVGIEKQGVINEKVEDSANSLPETNTSVSGNPSKKSGSIKIKSSRGIGSSSISQSRNAVLVQGETTTQKEPKLLHRGPRYNEQELNDSLEVIKKIMKMDAAEPFNAPVNPIALGIPDYFDVIDTPMDFGTICSNLENGVKYMNSEDVFKDVQYIWNNCYKYNNKGDYVLELMKRVKKNFMKYWTAAGLYSKQPHSTNGTESIQANDAALSSHGKMQVKGAHSKHKSRKRQGVKKHKDDCLCAICIMMRRRQEREKSEKIVEHLNETSNSPLSQDVGPKETSPIESPCGEDSTSNMENSLGPDVETDSEEKGEEVKLKGTDQLHSTLQEKQELKEKDNEMEIQMKEEDEISEHSRLDDRSEDEHSRQHQVPTAEFGGDVQFGGDVLSDTQKEETSIQHEDETAAAEQQKPEELPEKREERTKMYENLQRFENPMLLDLCGRLFPGTHKLVWGGPHSLVRRQGYVGNRSIHEAIATFMK